MPISIGEIIAKLKLDPSGFTVGVNTAKQEARGLADAMKNASVSSSASWSGAFSVVKQSITEAAGAMQLMGGILTASVGGAIAYAVKSASDLSEAVNKVEVVFDGSAKAVEDFAKSSATNLGLSQQATLDYAGSLGNMFVAMHLSSEASAQLSEGILSLAADIASFNNIGVDDALIKLKSGLQGEAEPLRSVGVLLSDVAIKAKATEVGLKGASGTLSEQQKVLLRYLVILDQTQKAQGDFARTATGMANSSRILQAQFEDLTAKIGDKFAGAANTAMGAAVQLLSVFNNLPSSIIATGAAVLGTVAAVGAAALALGGLVALLGGPLTLAFAGVVAWAAAMAIGIAQNWDAIVEMTGGMGIGVQDALRMIVKGMGWVVDIISAAARQIIMAFDVIYNGARILASAIIRTFEVMGEALKSALSALLSGDLEGFAAAIAGGFLASFQVATAGVGEELNQLATRAMGHIDATLDFLGGKTANAFAAAFDKGIESAKSFDFAALKKKILSELEGLAGAAGKAGEKSGKAAAEAAKKAAIDSVNEMLAVLGEKFKLHKEFWDSLTGDVRASLLAQAAVFKQFTQALTNIKLAEALDGVNRVIFITTEHLEAMRQKFPNVIKAIQDAGFAFRVLPPVLKDVGLSIQDATRLADIDIQKFAADSQASFNAFKAKLDATIGEAPKPFAALSIAVLKARDDLQDALAGNETLQVINAQLDIRRSIESTISTLEDYGKSLGLTGDALQRYVEDQIRNLGIFKGATAGELAKIIEEHKKAAIQLPGIWNDVFAKLSSGAKSWAASIFGVLDTIPGKFGDMARKVESTINTWVSFFDKILGLLHKFSNDIPGSISDALSKVVSLFKGMGKSAQDAGQYVGNGLVLAANETGKATNSISNSTSGMSEKVKAGFGIAAASAAGFATSLAITANSSSKAMGFLEATISSTLAGIAAGFAFGPVAGAITAGVSLLGGIIGLFHKKSAQQAEQERLNNEKLKADIAASAQATMNAALEGFQKALAFLDSLDQFTAPRKAKFQEFWKAMSRLMDGFVTLAKKWQGENLEKDKAIAEAIGAVAQGIAAAPAAFDAINSSFTIPDTQFEVFFSNLDRFMSRFFARADVWIEGTAKRAMKVANRLASVVDLISPFAQGMKDLVDLKPVSDDALNALSDGLQRLITKVGAIAEMFDKGWLKTLQFFSEKAQSALSLWKDAVEAIKATVDIPPLNEGAIDAVVANITAFITKLITASDSISAEALGKAASIANSILPIANAIKAWSEAAKLIHDYTAVAADTYDAILADFNRAISLINLMLGSAIDFLPKAVQFEDVMVQIANHLKAALDAFGPGLGAAASAFGLIVNTIQGGVPIGGDGGSFAPSSFAPSFAGGGAAASSPDIHIHVHAGTFVHESQLPDLVAEGLVKLKRTSRLQGILAT